MDWVAIITNIVNRIPIERVLFPPRDSTKALEKFAATMAAPVAPNKAPISEKMASTITAEQEKAVPAPEPAPRHDLPTSEETTQELKRRLGKELYRAELDLSNKLRIAGKPCDCLDSKHTLGLEAAAEELIAQEPGNTVYLEIIDWIKRNQTKLGIEAIAGGQYDEEYPRMAAEFKGFRKRIMGTTVLTAMVEPKEQITLGQAKTLAAEEVAKEVERRWPPFGTPSEDTMFFNVPEARGHLTSKGFVYTLRPKLRRAGKDVAVYGSYYKWEKIGDVWIDFIKEVKGIEELKEYISGSGFEKLEDWWEAAESSRFLFKVTLKEN